MAATARALLPFDTWPSLVAQPEIPANDNALREELINGQALSFQAAQPGAPVARGIYVLSAAWGDEPTGTLAIYVSGTWYYWTPFAGMIKDIGGVLYRWSGTAWGRVETILGAKGTDIASAATTNLATATGDYVHVTGTTTITALGTAAAGIKRWVRFAGALTLTHHATSLILPGGANITTAADDTALFVSEGGGNWRCVQYLRADGTPLTLGAAVNDRLDAYLRDDGYPKEMVWGEENLRRTKLALRRIAMGENEQLHIGILGDSWNFNRERWVEAFTRQLAEQYGLAAPGYTSFYSHSDGTVGGNADDAVATVTKSAGWSNQDGAQPSPDVGQTTSTVAGDLITVEYLGSADISEVTLFHMDSTGTFRYRYDGGSWSTVVLGGSGDLTLLDLDPPPSGPWTLEIDNDSGTVKLCGVDLKTTAPGIVVHKISRAGGTTVHWAGVDAAQWRDGIAALGITVMAVLLGTNDQNSLSPTTFQSNYGSILNDVRNELPLNEFLLIMPAENGMGRPTPMSEYATKILELAVLFEAAYMDTTYLIGAYDDRPDLWSDTAHPAPGTGGLMIADGVLRMFAAPKAEASGGGGSVAAADITDSTTVGRALLTAANPSAVRYPRINADNSVTFRSASDLVGTDLAVRQAPSLHSTFNITGGTVKGKPGIGTHRGARTTYQPSLDRLLYLPFYVPSPRRIVNPVCEVSTAQASATARVGLVSWDPAAIAPIALLADFGTADLSATGTKTFTGGATPYDIVAPGWYAEAFIAGGSATAPTFYQQSFQPLGVPSAGLGTSTSVMALYDGAEGSQRTGGFENPPSLAADLGVLMTSTDEGWVSIPLWDVIPIP